MTGPELHDTGRDTKSTLVRGRMPTFKRYVIGSQLGGRSSVIDTEISNVQSRDGYFWRSTLWATDSYPPDNRHGRDISAEVTAREPGSRGVIFRALEIAPDDPDTGRYRSVMAAVHDDLMQRHAPSSEEIDRHPGMHRTSTLDFVTCVRGEIHLVTDVDEVRMLPGDTAIIRGGNHAWSNRSDEPCLLMVVLVNAADEDEEDTSLLMPSQATTGSAS
jgi:hypothetical protein